MPRCAPWLLALTVTLAAVRAHAQEPTTVSDLVVTSTRLPTPAALAPDARKFLDAVSGACGMAQPALGLGKDVRIAGPSVSGAALWANGRYIHVCAFAANGGAPEPHFRTRMSRPSRRR